MDNRIGAQLYTLRDFCQNAEDFDKSMKKISEMGYKTIQASAIGPMSGETVKEICDKYGLEVVCTHRPFDNYENKLEDDVAYHKAMNCEIAGLGCMPFEYIENEWTRESLTELIGRMNKVSDELAKHGITFAYHNHAFEFEKFDGKYIMDYFLEEGNFSFIFDVYWLTYSGIDPVDFITKMGKRAICIHFKDIEADKETMTEVGQGITDWDAVIKACAESGAKYALVEQDTCQRDPFESMQMSYDYLSQKEFFKV